MRYAPRRLRGLAFRAVHPERQTNDQGLSVKAFERIRYLAQELFPVGAVERRQGAHGHAKLIGDGQPDALLTQIEREQASGELPLSLRLIGRFMCLYFWQCSFCRRAEYKNAARGLSSGFKQGLLARELRPLYDTL